jgi:pimeloyl-[acyl-carrier protein] methyl ester esterase
MKLYTRSSGAGPELVLIHGWGLHGGVWDILVPLLEPAFRITRVDLPGHGRSAWNGEASLEDMMAAVLAAAPESAVWLGWSLGGLVAARATVAAPARVSRLVLLASTPSFVRRPGWQPAMLPALLEAFAADLRCDYARTLNRFLALQVRGSESAGVVLRHLHGTLLAQGRPVPAALDAGLEILRTTDLRERFAEIACPVLLLQGERDSLVPPVAGRQAARLIADARLRLIEGAGHAPFISRPRQVAAFLEEFLQPAADGRAGEAHGS